MKKNDDKKEGGRAMGYEGLILNQKPVTEKTKLVRLTMSQIHNLSLLEKMREFDQNFKTHAQSINTLFYSYIQVMQSHKEELALTENEIYSISEVANFFGNME